MSAVELERITAEERKSYFKAWREANKERTAEHRRRYWERRALERLRRESNGHDTESGRTDTTSGGQDGA